VWTDPLPATGATNLTPPNRPCTRPTLSLPTRRAPQGILSELNTQRETMFGIRSNLHEVDDHISRGRQTLAVMSRRVFTNKAIMCLIILALLGAIVLIIAYKLS